MKRIMFNDEMCLTQAAIDGRKSQLRFILTPQPIYSDKGGIIWRFRPFGLDLWKTKEGACANFVNDINQEKSHAIPFHRGQITAVAQCYKNLTQKGDISTEENLQKEVGWKNKGAVLAELMPYRAEIVLMELQQLRDMTADDLVDEGVCRETDEKGETVYRVLATDENLEFKSPDWEKAAEYFFSRKFGKKTWMQNPWVLKYKFKVVKKDYNEI